MSATYVSSFCHPNSVRRLLRHKISQEYFRDGRWLNDPREATSYPDVLLAAQACIRYGLEDVEMVLRLDPAAADIFCKPLG